MTVTSLRLKDNQYEAIKVLADFYGETATAFMKRVILERLEDESDYQDAAKNLKTSQDETVSRQEVTAHLSWK